MDFDRRWLEGKWLDGDGGGGFGFYEAGARLDEAFFGDGINVCAVRGGWEARRLHVHGVGWGHGAEAWGVRR